MNQHFTNYVGGIHFPAVFRVFAENKKKSTTLPIIGDSPRKEDAYLSLCFLAGP
jgi:hypothetical protein